MPWPTLKNEIDPVALAGLLLALIANGVLIWKSLRDRGRLTVTTSSRWAHNVRKGEDNEDGSINVTITNMGGKPVRIRAISFVEFPTILSRLLRRPEVRWSTRQVRTKDQKMAPLTYELPPGDTCTLDTTWSWNTEKQPIFAVVTIHQGWWRRIRRVDQPTRQVQRY
jgi:hypothetical protein